MEGAASHSGLTDDDLVFVVAHAAPGSANPSRLAALVRDDPDFRRAMVGDEKVLEAVLDDEEVFLKVGPALFFEVLLRGSLRELETAAYTVERSGRSSIPVFDTSEVTELMRRDGVIEYLAHMLASFTKINSYVVPVRVRPGVRRGRAQEGPYRGDVDRAGHPTDRSVGRNTEVALVDRGGAGQELARDGGEELFRRDRGPVLGNRQPQRPEVRRAPGAAQRLVRERQRRLVGHGRDV